MPTTAHVISMLYSQMERLKAASGEEVATECERSRAMVDTAGAINDQMVTTLRIMDMASEVGGTEAVISASRALLGGK